MTFPRTAEALFQTPEQKLSGIVTFRAFLDHAWRNIDGPADWKKLPPAELFACIEQRYFSERPLVKAV